MGTKTRRPLALAVVSALVILGADALGKPEPYCASGLCLLLMPGNRVGLIEPPRPPPAPSAAEIPTTVEAAPANLIPVTPISPEVHVAIEKPAYEPELGAARRLLRKKGEGTVAVPVVQHTPLVIPQPDVTEDFLTVYFPALPQTGSLHLRKLWEGCTGLATETVTRGPGLFLQERTKAYGPPCGGIHLKALNESARPADDTPQCAEIKASAGTQPVLIKSSEPVDFVPVEFKERADVILLLIRNPVDAYQSLFLQKNPKYARTRELVDVEWKMTFKQYLDEYWEKYIRTFDGVTVPRVVMRYEDMYRDPEDFMKEALVFTGTGKAAGLESDAITQQVRKVVEATQELQPKRIIGLGFDVLMSLSAEDQALAMQVLFSHNESLEALGYGFYLEADGIPPKFKVESSEQVVEERWRLDQLKAAGMKMHQLLGKEFHHDVTYSSLLVGSILTVCCLWLVCCVALKKCLAYFGKKTDGSGGGFVSDVVAVKDRLRDRLTNPNSKRPSARPRGAAASATAADKRAEQRSSENKAAGLDILAEAKEVMQQNVESPAAKLARLKALREKLAQVRD